MLRKKHSLLFQIGPLCSLVDNKNPPSFPLRIHIERKGLWRIGSAAEDTFSRRRKNSFEKREMQPFIQNLNVVQPNPALKCTEGRNFMSSGNFLLKAGLTLVELGRFIGTLKSLTPPRATRHKWGIVHHLSYFTE